MKAKSIILGFLVFVVIYPDLVLADDDSMFSWVNDLWSWLETSFKALKDLLLDIPKIVLKETLGVLTSLYDALFSSLDCCWNGSGSGGGADGLIGQGTGVLNDLLNLLGAYSPIIVYLLDKTSFPAALGCIGAAVAVRGSWRIFCLLMGF